MFEPSPIGTSPSGLANSPRPFVFRAWHLDAKTFRRGERFHFDLHVFELKDPVVAHLVSAFAQLAREGVGPRRGRAELESVWQLDRDRRPALRIYDGTALEEASAPLMMDLAGSVAVNRMAVRFVTPTELKGEQGQSPRPEFPILFGRARDRIGTLRSLYGAGPLDLDFRAIGERAKHVRMTHCRLHTVDVERRSSRTGQVHPLGGFVGEAEYEGELGEFFPFLKAAEWTGVGRQTVWGKGEIRVVV